jgi:hypothetical protein
VLYSPDFHANIPVNVKVILFSDFPNLFVETRIVAKTLEAGNFMLEKKRITFVVA